MPRNKHILLRHQCPVCNTSIETREFTYKFAGNVWTHAPRIRFKCPSCNAALKIREKYYRYYHLFMGYVGFIIVVGFIAIFFVEESMHVTFGMLGAMLLSAPLIVLAAINNKAEVVGEDT
jgi:hypothetical protein